MSWEPRILVIDDDDVAAAMVRAVLVSAGFHVVVSSTPIGATRLVRDHAIDALVCDVNMPAMSGDALARLFRSSRVLMHVRLVLISGTDPSQLAEIERSGVADGVVGKDDIATRLAPLLRRLLAS